MICEHCKRAIEAAIVPPGYVVVRAGELADLKERADFNVVEFAYRQRESPGPFIGLAGTPNAAIAAAPKASHDPR